LQGQWALPTPETKKQVQGLRRKQYLYAWKAKALLRRLWWFQYLPSQETQEGLQSVQIDNRQRGNLNSRPHLASAPFTLALTKTEH
jgi:hypothetical protein